VKDNECIGNVLKTCRRKGTLARSRQKYADSRSHFKEICSGIAELTHLDESRDHLQDAVNRIMDFRVL